MTSRVTTPERSRLYPQAKGDKYVDHSQTVKEFLLCMMIKDTST